MFEGEDGPIFDGPGETTEEVIDPVEDVEDGEGDDESLDEGLVMVSNLSCQPFRFGGALKGIIYVLRIF